MLKFPDDTQIRVCGLDEILAALFSEGRQADEETAEEIINRLEAIKNFIPSSDRVRREYAYVLLKEYRKYVRDRQKSEASFTESPNTNLSHS
jgi:predicted nucleic acid-binding protein